MDIVYAVTILPENKTVLVPKGTNLLMAAKMAEIDIESPCGGHGTCAKCAVKLISGNVEMKDDTHLTEDLREQGYILACQVKVTGDMVVEVPLGSRLTRHKVLLASKRSIFGG